MLAYVFWHWPRPGVLPDEYERLQGRFHAALRDAPPAGFLGSRSEAIGAVPWITREDRAYEDWYLLENGIALEPLNEAAVSASRQAPHDAAAAVASGGTAGLYRLRLGSAETVVPTVAAWFSKPEGMTYAELDALLESPVRSHRCALWCRQMVLGPTPEFCLQSAGPIELPAPIVPLLVDLRRVWPSSGT
jgi:hypothetical protein